MLLPSEYFDRYYDADLQIFGGMSMCGFTMADALSEPKRSTMHCLKEFTLCQFGLNLLNQATHAHCPSHCSAWKQFSPPFADTHGCFSGHGMGSHLPYSILRFAQQPNFGSEIQGLSLAWSDIGEYARFFVVDLVEVFSRTAGGSGFPKSTFYEAINVDRDCAACCLVDGTWEHRSVTSLLS